MQAIDRRSATQGVKKMSSAEENSVFAAYRAEFNEGVTFSRNVQSIRGQVREVNPHLKSTSKDSVVRCTDTLSQQRNEFWQDFEAKADKIMDAFANNLGKEYKTTMVHIGRRGRLAGKNKDRFKGALVLQRDNRFKFIPKGKSVILLDKNKKTCRMPRGLHFVVDGMDNLGQLHLDVCKADGTKAKSKAVTIVGANAYTVTEY